MVRPRKSEAERRSRSIRVPVTTADAAKRAADARLTRGAYIRRRALGQPFHTAAIHRLGVRERVGLRRIGVSLDQIARALNSGASAPTGTLEAEERAGELAVSSTSMLSAEE